MPPRSSTASSIRQLAPGDTALFRAMLAMFGEAFDDAETYTGAEPSDAYIDGLLASDHFIALVAERDASVAGALVAYELKKFERERSEIYIYDLAVSDDCRRQGIATALIAELRHIAVARGAYVIFVQADYVDPPAIALYSKLGAREDVLHFDIAVK